MKTKYILAVAGFLGTVVANAQVNLDKPISIGPSDHVYASEADGKAAYYIPISLDRNTDTTFTTLDNRMTARFGAGLNQQLFAAVQELVNKSRPGLQLRVIRPVNVELSAGTDVPDDFTAILSAVGAVDLMGPAQFSLNVDRQYHWYKQDGGERLFEQLFGDSGRDHVGTIQYEFDAIQGGKPCLSRTAVALFGTDHLLPGNGKVVGLMSNDAFALANAPAPAPEILMDKDSKCWTSVKPGQYCIRQK